ncbi:MAG: hypothetical protein AB8B93_16890 [Pseudomonadales bacterium]
MIETLIDAAVDSVDHIGSGTVTVNELLTAVDATRQRPDSICWDFRNADFDVALSVLKAPCYPPVRSHINTAWQHTRVAFTVSAHLHKHMIELFAAEGDFAFEWQVFFSHGEAQSWLQRYAPPRSAAN